MPVASVTKHHKQGSLKQEEFFSLTALEARRLKSSCQQGHALSESYGGILLASSSICCLSCNLWLVAASLPSLPPPSRGLPLPVSLSVSLSSSYKDTSQIGLGPPSSSTASS